MFKWVPAPKKKRLSVSSYFKCFLTIKVIWSLLGKLVYSSLSGLWFFLLFTNLKVNFLHTGNKYIIEFIYHLHLAKLVPRVHHAMFRSKHLASFLFSWGHYHLLTFLFHITYQLLLYQPLMVPFFSKSLDHILGTSKSLDQSSLPGLGISLLRRRREKRHHFP